MNEREMFISALQIDDPAERDSFLDEATSGDAQLRQRVEGLLGAFDDAGSFLQPVSPSNVMAALARCDRTNFRAKLTKS